VLRTRVSARLQQRISLTPLYPIIGTPRDFRTSYPKKGSGLSIANALPQSLIGDPILEYYEHMILMMRRVLIAVVVTLVSLCSLHAQSVSPSPRAPVKAIYTPQPVYQADWAKRGLTGKGVVLVTVDKNTGKVTGAQMLESTGSKLLDGSALEAYSRWRFAPGTVSQVKMPVEFKNRPKPQTSKRTLPQPAIFSLLIFLGLGALVMATLKRRKQIK
jgi:TonB family protein